MLSNPAIRQCHTNTTLKNDSSLGHALALEKTPLFIIIILILLPIYIANSFLSTMRISSPLINAMAALQQ